MSDTTQISLHITGLSCAGCAGRAERALAAVDGVRSASVNLANATGQVEAAQDVALTDLTGALTDAGYPAAESQAVLVISGMNCASCVGRVEKALLAVPGVLSASVNLANETAQIRYLTGAARAADLARKVTEAGYPARLSGAVEDEAEQASQRKADEISALGHQMLIAALLTLPVFLIEMGGHMVPALHHWVAANIGMQNSYLLQFALTTLVLAGPGRQFYAKGFPALFRGAPDMNALVALGTAAAYGFSVISTFAPRLLPAGTANVYYEAAAVIVVLILTGRFLEARAKGRTGAAIRKLAGLQPKTAMVVAGGDAVETPVEEIGAGDLIRVRPGERIAVDGEIVSGSSYIDESMISGEPVPVAKSRGDEVTAGTINGNSALEFRATRVGRDTVLAQIIRMVEQAQGAKLPVQGLVDRITLWFVPAVIAVAALTVLAWSVFGPAPSLPLALVAGVSVLIIACPCAMGLATPTSIMVGIGRAAQMGVLFRKGDALQRLQEVKVVALDKTGTLTEGRPALTELICAEGCTREEVLRLTGAAEAQSEHPIARAITAAAGKGLPKASGFEAIPGYGLRAEVEGRVVLAGAARLMAREGIAFGALQAEGERLAERGETPLYAAVDGRLAAVIAVADPIKPGTPAAIKAFHEQGLKVAMITGDAAATAQAIARRLGIDAVKAECLPADKVKALQELQAEHGTLAFVGDGINDAPALAAADAGIAIGTGTDVAIEAADVVLVSGDLRGVVNALTVSRATMRNIRQNLGWAFGYNVLLIPVAAGLLYPFGGPLLSPALAAGAMALSSVFVLSNALRLRRLKPAIDEDQAAPAPKADTKQEARA
ncbi:MULTISPECIES: heavy metal translocating P-type ATPase [unclassified Leisingera]|uniref:heavy metal translocating P-type ATPase n=1 Tax=unclassified Leisingera TaxID=2614906 RepID=UPI0002E2F006|nr:MULTISPECIES: heavy metal translocating P-type ATPase [unclassified Leisingera]KIC23489.1 ATPase [Leisingera sp. ANG-S3]KIC54970.1 ATPase [Leisingera sp. ANG-S]KID08667.1 ATPase [Leisingera sp. ANG1]